MKESYFTSETIGSKSLELKHDLINIRHGADITFAPERSALLVLDMQKYFFSPDSHAFIPSAQAIIPGLKKLIDSYSRRGLLRIYTRHLNTDNDAAMMNRWWTDIIRENDRFSGLIDELDFSDRVIIEKTQYDAFYRTGLDLILRENGITQLVICGVMTHLCCETTARSGFVNGYEIFFMIDGTATYNEKFHRATLLNLSHGFARPMLISEILKG